MWHPCTPVTQTGQNADVAQKAELNYLEVFPLQCSYTPQSTHMSSSAPSSLGCGCFSAYTYVSALRRYQACLMQWTCISISAGQTQINRNALKKNVSNKFLCKSGREREGERVKHTNEPASFIWKWTKTFLMKTPRPGRDRGAAWMFIYFLIFFRLWTTHITVITQSKRMKVLKGKQIEFYFNLRTDALGANLNHSLRPSTQLNEGDRQNNFCQEVLCLIQMWDRSSVRSETWLQ